MSSQQSQMIKKSLQELKTQKCNKKGCMSQDKGQLQIVWFGKQYQHKQMTCSSCYVMNDQLVQKSIPTFLNVLPLVNFIDILIKEYKVYEDKKKSQNWIPGVIKNKQKQMIDEVKVFETRLCASLKGLELALEGFLKKILAKTKQVFTNEVFNSIIQMNNKFSFEQLLTKIHLLVQHLNYSQLSKGYEFQQIQVRNKKIEKLRQKIQQVNQRTMKVLQSLLQQLKLRNQNIRKI